MWCYFEIQWHTLGQREVLLFVNRLGVYGCIFLSPSPGKTKPKGGGGESAAELCPVTSLVEEIGALSARNLQVRCLTRHFLSAI